MFCPYCGTKIQEDAKFCASCGKVLHQEKGTETASSGGAAPNTGAYTPPSSYRELGG